VAEAMLPFHSEVFGSPSSPHGAGATARRATEEARAQVAALVGAEPDEILFTSSATEANNLAIKGVATAAGQNRRGIAAAATEHISILHPLRTLERHGFGVTLLPVDRDGFVEPGRLEELLTDRTLLVSVAHASGEIGTIQPLAEIRRVTR